MRRNVLRSLGLPLLAAAGLILAGCSTPPPAFTIFIGSGSVQVPPTQYCDATGVRDCQANGAAATVVSIPDGQVVQVSAPDSVAQAQWQLAAWYKDTSNGDSYIACSPMFAANQQYAYTVRPPSGDQLVLIQIYQPANSALLSNGLIVSFRRGTWLLTNDANGSPTYPKAGDNLCEDQGT